MTVAQMDVIAGTYCELVPGLQPWGRGFYLVAANMRVEAGPFATQADAEHAADWLDWESRGVHPGPWRAHWSAKGLLVGSRYRVRPRHLRATG